MSRMYNRVKAYYDNGLWTKDRVKAVVKLGSLGITPEEYELITGEAYEG